MIGYMKIENGKFRLSGYHNGGRVIEGHMMIEISRSVEPHLRMQLASRELDNLCFGLDQIAKGAYDGRKT